MITNEEKLACVKRELRLREYVYPRRVSEGSMTQETADQEIAVMEAIVADYTAQVDFWTDMAGNKTLNGHGPAATEPAGDPPNALTRRERQIMQLVCEGLSNKDIARQITVSDGTVKLHLHHIYRKLAIQNQTRLALLAAGNSHG